MHVVRPSGVDQALRWFGASPSLSGELAPNHHCDPQPFGWSSAPSVCERRCTEPLLIDVGNDATSPSRARQLLHVLLAEHGWDRARIDDACIVASELIANAVTHGAGLTSCTLSWDHDTVRFEVADRTTDMPLRRSPGPHDAGGRGLLLVDLLVQGWGAERILDGNAHKLVWATVGPARPATLER